VKQYWEKFLSRQKLPYDREKMPEDLLRIVRQIHVT
jgi:hypothetical protein